MRKRRADGTVAAPPPKKLRTNTAVAVESWATRLRPRKRSAPIISPMPAHKPKKAKHVAAKQVRAPSTIRPSALRAAARRAARLMAAKRALLWAHMRSLFLLFGRRSAFSALLFRYKGILAERERERRLLAVRALAQRLFRALVKRNAVRQRVRRVFRALVWRRFTLRARMRRLLIKLARRVRGDRGKLVSVALQPFVFMLSRDTGEFVTELSPNHRGQAWIQDSAGRYHQQLSDFMLELPKLAMFGIAENVVYWNHEHPDVFDYPVMERWMHFRDPRVEDAINIFKSPLSGLRIVDIEVQERSYYEALDVENFASGGVAFVFNKYAGATSLAGARTLDKWLQPASICTFADKDTGLTAEYEGLREDATSISNACCYDIILGLYKAKIEALQRPDLSRKDHKYGRFKGIQMTHEGLHRFFHAGKKTFSPLELGLSLRQFRTFFVYLGLRLTVFDITGAEIPEACYVPTRPNAKLVPCHVWVLHHSSHLFLLTEGLNSLSKLPRSIMTSTPRLTIIDRTEVERKPSSHYYISSRDVSTEFIDCLDKLTDLHFKKRGVVRVACPVEMTVALHTLVTRCKYLPGIVMKGNKIVSLKLRVDNTDIILSPPDSAPNDCTVMLHDADEFALYHALQQKLVRSVINRDTLSCYSEELAQSFRELSRKPLHYNTGYRGADLYDAEAARALQFTGCATVGGARLITSEHDISKAHTAAILAMRHFPVFSVFDRFKPFDAATMVIKDHALYVVRRRPDCISADSIEFLLLDNDCCFVTAETARICAAWRGVVIESFVEPSRLVSAEPAHSAICGIYSSTLPVALKKFLVNKVVGLLGRLFSARGWTQLFTNKGEAFHFKAAHPGSQLMKRNVGEDRDCSLYFVHKEERVDLVDGFFPIHHAVSDFVRIQLYKRAREVGRPLVAVNTDALWFAGAEVAVPKEHTLCGIGKWGVRAGGLRVPDAAHKARTSTFVPTAVATICVEALHVKNEYDSAEMGALLDAHNCVIVLGDLPGVGKSTALEMHCCKDTTLFVAPTNKLKAHFALAFHAVTLDALLGLRVVGDTGDGSLDGGAQDMAGIAAFSTIVFDEVFFHTVPKLARIGSFMRKHATLEDGFTQRKFFATGDPFQNPPIEQLAVASARAYYMEAVSVLFPSQLTLRVCKRVGSAADQQRLEMIKTRLFTNKEHPASVIRAYAKPIDSMDSVRGVAVTYKNTTAWAVNSYLHEKAVAGRTDTVRVGEKSYYPGLELVCRKRLEKVQKKRLGSACEYKCAGALHVNFTVTVSRVNEDGLELDDGDGNQLKVSFNQAAHHLAYTHAYTGHSFQGLSVSGSITIFDHSFSFVDEDGRPCGVTAEWAYTALSRARDMSEVYYYMGPCDYEPRDPDKHFRAWLQQKIRGHKAADKKAGRTWTEAEYITVEYVYKLLKGQCDRCAMCPAILQREWEKGDHEQVSIDRKDGGEAHVKMNCQLLCLQCNKRKQ